MTIAAAAAPNVAMTGKNVGDLLNTAGVSWGWFYGDFAAGFHYRRRRHLHFAIQSPLRPV